MTDLLERAEDGIAWLTLNRPDRLNAFSPAMLLALGEALQRLGSDAGVGAIVTNLQALESALRRFLVERYGQCSNFPKMGDTTACRSYLTAFES